MVEKPDRVGWLGCTGSFCIMYGGFFSFLFGGRKEKSEKMLGICVEGGYRREKGISFFESGRYH